MTATRPLVGTLLALGTLALEPAVPLLGVDAAALATGRFVAPGGNDANPGTLAQPWRTVQTAIGRLAPGDTLYLRGGAYYGRVTVSVSGSAGAPIVIRSYPGEDAMLDSGTPDFRSAGNQDWELVNAALGEYRSVRTFSDNDQVYAYVAGVPGYMNERVALVPYESAAAFRSISETYVDGTTPFYVGPGTFWDPADQRIHVRLAKTADFRAAEARYGTVFAADLPDPRQHSIVHSQASTTLTVSGSYLVFASLTVNPANTTVELLSASHDVVFDGVTVWLGDSAIETEGARNVVITRSRIYGDAPPWVFWSDMKDPPAPANLLRATSIDLRSGTRDVEISYCHIRGSGQDLIGTNQDEGEIDVHHNRIENATDDAFELEGSTDVGRITIHDNYVLNCLTAVAPGQDSPSFTGPLLVYRNVIALLRDPPINRKEGINGWNGGYRHGFEYMFKHGTGAADQTRNAHYYHNTLVLLNSDERGLNLIPKDPTDARIANNLCVTVNGNVNRDYRNAAGAVVDGNLYWKMNTVDTEPLLASHTTVAAFSSATGFEVHGIGSTPRRGTDPRFVGLRIEVVDPTRMRWAVSPASEVPAITDFLLAAGSPAIGAGIALPSHPVLGTLPDSRTSRDLGALPFGLSPSEFAAFPFVVQAEADRTPPATPRIRLGSR
jgi:hypothetical protein